jgi:hypothetical protein
MKTLQQISPPIKDAITGVSIKCQCGCGRVARHVHHIKPRCQGGTDHPNNILLLCQKCHVAHHSKQGDFSRWGKMGGEITAQTMKSIPNLRQFQGEAGRARWIKFCERKANAQMGVQ